MVYKIIWSPSALDDLREIVRYIRKRDAEAAKRFGRKLIEKAESLANFPERGRMLQRFEDPEIREIFLGSFRMAYRVHREPAHVEIIRIWHGARSEENVTL